MKKLSWIWFLGFFAWLADALVQLRLHARAHAELALMVALVFLAAALLYRNQPKR
jgi:hypothetical protein